MDLEYGKIVEEWNVHPDVPVENFLPSNKYAQMTSEQTLIGTSHNSIYRIDPRVNGNKLVDEQFKQYVSKNKFSSAATDSKGRLAVASEKGDIRLFDTIGKNAKTGEYQTFKEKSKAEDEKRGASFFIWFLADLNVSLTIDSSLSLPLSSSCFGRSNFGSRRDFRWKIHHRNLQDLSVVDRYSDR